MTAYNNSVVNQFDTVESGNAGAGVEIVVYISDTEPRQLATLSEVGGGSKANPFFTDEKGNYSFDVADGTYDIIINPNSAAPTSLSGTPIFSTSSNPNITGLKVYSTVAAMIADSANLSIGDSVATLAYNRPVYSTWSITSSGAGDMSDATLSIGGSKFASLQIEPVTDVRAFGAWGDYVPAPLASGYAHDDTLPIANAIKNCDHVTCSVGDKFAITDHVPCNFDNHVIDFGVGEFYWFGVAGAVRKVGRDRAMFEIYGESGAKFQESGPWAQWLEGAETFPCVDSVELLQNEFILMAVGNVPNGPSESYMIRPMPVRASHSNPLERFQSDYRLGWSHADATFRYFTASPVKNVSLAIGHMEDKTEYGYSEEVGGVRACASGVVMELACNCSVKINTSKNWQFPTVMTYFTTDCTVKDIFQLPSERDSDGIVGWGIIVQWNNALRAKSYNLTAQGNRRVLDYTQAAYCYAENVGGESTRDGELTTHGVYEHNLTYVNTRGFMSFANSGAEFGESTKDITVMHHHGSDIFAVTNVQNMHLIDCRCDSIRVNSVGLTMDNCSLYDLETAVNNLCQINNWSAQIGKPYPKTNAVINNSKLGSNGVVYLVDQDIAADEFITFNNCDLELRGGDFAGPANIIINGGTLRPKSGTGQLVLVANPTTVKIVGSDIKNVAFGVTSALTTPCKVSIYDCDITGDDYASSFWANQDSSSVSGNYFKMHNCTINWDNITDSGFIFDPLGVRNPNWYTKLTNNDIVGTGASASNLRIPAQRGPMRFGDNTLSNITKSIDSPSATRIEYNTLTL